MLTQAAEFPMVTVTETEERKPATVGERQSWVHRLAVAATAAGGIGLGLAETQAMEANIPERPNEPKLTDHLKNARQGKQVDVGWLEFVGELQARGIDLYAKKKHDIKDMEPALIDLLNHRNYFVRRHAIASVGELELASAVPHLEKFLHGQDFSEASSATSALGRIAVSHAEACKVLSAGLESETTIDRVLRGLSRSSRQQKASVIDAKLKTIFDGSEENHDRKLGSAKALLQYCTTHQEPALIHVLKAHQDSNEDVFRPASKFLKKEIHRNPHPNVTAILIGANEHGRTRKDGWQVVHTGYALANVESVGGIKQICKTLSEMQGPEAAVLATRIYKSFDLIENGLSDLKILAAGHPDQPVRIILLDSIGETFRGPHIQEWVAQRRATEATLVPKKVAPKTATD